MKNTLLTEALRVATSLGHDMKVVGMYPDFHQCKHCKYILSIQETNPKLPFVFGMAYSVRCNKGE